MSDAPKPRKKFIWESGWGKAAIIIAASLALSPMSVGAGVAYAAATNPTLSVNLGTGDGLTARVLQLAALITVLSLAPSIIIMTTSFVRIVVVLSPAYRHRPAAGAAERGDHLAVAVPDCVRDAACLE